MTLCRYAKSRGVAPASVYDARDRGRITVAADGTVDPDEADRELDATRRQRRASSPWPVAAVNGRRRPGRPLKHPGTHRAHVLELEEAYRRKETALALRAELEVERLRESWREPALRVIAEEGVRVRSALEQFADRHYAGLAAKHGVTDPEAFRRDLEDAIRELLTQLATDTAV